MQNTYRILLNWTKSAVRSIAFLPIPMMLAGLLIGMGLFYFETSTTLSAKVSEYLPALVVSSQETARSILGLFIGGLITLVVFTFTQLMSLFNQVASSYSPRLLPLFTSDRSLQFTMGFYLGTIVMTLIVLLSIRGDDDGYVSNLSVLICILCGVISLGIFMHFVTNISGKIQVDAIISRVYQHGISNLELEVDRECFLQQSEPDSWRSWYAIPSPIDGFIGTINHSKLSELAKIYKTRFYISTAKGEYVPEGFPLLRSEASLDEDQVREIIKAVSPITRKFDDWYLPPIRLLTEIALKAMSPGINDPGTAMDVMDRLTGLLNRLMDVPIYNFYQSKNGGEVWIASRDFRYILQDVMQQLRTYCREDVMVTRRLFQMLYHLLGATGNGYDLQQNITAEIQKLLADARANIHNPGDRAAIADDVRLHRVKLQELLENTDFLGDPRLRQRGLVLGA